MSLLWKTATAQHLDFTEYGPGEEFGDEQMADHERGIYAAYPEGHPKAGYGAVLKWHKDTGHVTEIETHPSVRREGLAAAAWHEARRRGHDVKHSADRSDEGDAWAKSVGGHLPPLKRQDW